MRILPELIMFDLDGTILQADHKTISEETCQTLRQFVDRGVPLAINTGRCANIIPFEIFPSITYTITCNGACILDSQKRVLRSSYISEENLRTAWKVIKKYNVIMQLFSDQDIIMERKVLQNLSDYSQILPGFHMHYLQKGVAKEIGDFEKSVSDGMNRITKINFPGRAIEHAPALKKELEDLQLFEISSDGYNLEATAKACNKGSALSWVCDTFGIDRGNVAAFGDGINDISMLRDLRWGVAMGNASEIVKEAASYITASNTENGVARFLRRKFGD